MKKNAVTLSSLFSFSIILACCTAWGYMYFHFYRFTPQYAEEDKREKIIELAMIKYKEKNCSNDQLAALYKTISTIKDTTTPDAEALFTADERTKMSKSIYEMQIENCARPSREHVLSLLEAARKDLEKP